MLDRLQGLETEYAVRYRPEAGERPPGNDVIFTAIRESVEALVRTSPGHRKDKQHFFVENGGAFYHEEYPSAPGGGLLEGSTPECLGPGQLCLYQRAQEALLIRALPQARRHLRMRGHRGRLMGLLKNCKDGFGHIYGTQENYEVEVASRLSLLLFRVGLGGLAGLGAVLVTALFLLLIPCLLATVLLIVAVLVVQALVPRWRRAAQTLFADEHMLQARVGRVLLTLSNVVLWPVGAGLGVLIKLFAFRRLRRTATAFLVTRPIFTGAGTLDGAAFRLSERGGSIRRRVRLSFFPDDRAIYDTGHLIKPLLSPVSEVVLGRVLRRLGLKEAPVTPLSYFASVFRRRQRIQLGLSDANMAEVAEYLKLATTTLVFDLAEAGALDDLPRVRDPVAALRIVSEDPTLCATVDTTAGPLRALDVQRRYLDRAREVIERQGSISLEATQLLSMWAETLDALESRPESLFGRVDWVTKRIMIDESGGEDRHAKKKIDLRYHELGTGYFALLQEEGLSPRLLSTEEVERAIFEAPADTPAAHRARWIRDLADRDLDGVISWHYAEVPDPAHGDRACVIRLDDRRK